MPRQDNQIHDHVFADHKTLYGSNTYPSKSWFFKCYFSFKVRQHGQQQVNLQYNLCWILQKITGLLVHTISRTIFTKNSFLHFSQLLPTYFTPLLFRKTILNVPNITPFLYNSAIFKLPIFTYSHPYNLLRKLFLYLKHLANSGCIKGPMSKRVLWRGLSLF